MKAALKVPSYRECKRLNIPEIRVRNVAGKRAHVWVDFFSCDSDLLAAAFNRIREAYEPYLRRYFQRYPNATIWTSVPTKSSIICFAFDVLKDEAELFLSEITPVLYDKRNYRRIGGQPN